MFPRARAHALPLALLVLALFIGFQEVIGPERALAFRDHTTVFKPRWHAVRDSLLQGELPVLTRSHQAGIPLEHLLNGTYTPLVALLFLGNFDVAYDLFIVAHFALLGLGTYLLVIALNAPRLGRAPPGPAPRGAEAGGPPVRAQATLAAGIAMLAGPVVSLENLVVNLMGLACAPWLLAAFHRTLLRPDSRSAAALALVIGFAAQSTIPEVLVLEVAGALAITLGARPRLRAAHAWALGGAAVLGLAIASLVLGPVLTVLSTTRRGQGFGYDESSGWALNAPQVLELFVPSFWATERIPFLNAPIATGTTSAPYFMSLYFGTALALACAGALIGGRRGRWLAAATALFLVVAMGKNAPLHRVVASLPLLRSSRFAIKYMLPVTGGVAALAAFALEGVGARRAGRTLAALAALEVLLLGAALTQIASPAFEPFLARFLAGYELNVPFQGVPPAAFPAIAAAAIRPRAALALGAAVLLALAAGAAAVRALASRERLLRGALVVVVVLDLAVATRETIAGAPVEVLAMPEAVETIVGAGEQRFYPFEPSTMLPEAVHQEGHTFFEDERAEAFRRARYGGRNVRRYFDIDLDAQSNLWHLRIFMRTAFETPPDEELDLLARFGVEYITSWAPDVPRTPVLPWSIPGEQPHFLYRLPAVRRYVSAYPRWRSIASTKVSDAEVVALLVGAGAARDEALVVDAPDVATSSAGCATAPRLTRLGAPGAVPVEVEIDTACRALVVVEEPLYPGWAAVLDGADTPLIMAEAGYLSAFCPPGQHRLRFEYRPFARRWAPISLVASLLTVALLIWRPRRGARDAGADGARDAGEAGAASTTTGATSGAPGS